MRQGPLYVLLTTLCVTSAVHAEESQPLALNPVPTAQAATPAPATDSASQITALQQQLAESQRQLGELQSGERETAQISRLRQDNQRLKLQLKQAQAEQPPRLLSEQQLWYAIGAGTALLAFVIGRLSAGGRNKTPQRVGLTRAPTRHQHHDRPAADRRRPRTVRAAGQLAAAGRLQRTRLP